MQSHLFIKKLSIIALTLIMASIFLWPSTHSYGNSFITAKLKSQGTYSEILRADDIDAYYQVNCSAGELLTVSINYSANFDLNLYLYDIDPTNDLIDSSTMNGTYDIVEFHVSTAGFYYIRVSNEYDNPNNISFTLTITLQQDLVQIPGFELLFVVFSILIVIELAIFYKNRKLIKIS